MSVRFILMLGCLFAPFPGEASTVLAKGLFSYEVPPGWFVHPQSNSQFPVASTNEANILVRIEKSTASIDNFLRTFSAFIETKQKARITNSECFATAAGLDGYRIIAYGPLTPGADNTPTEKVFYIFDVGAEQKIVVEASCSPARAAQNVPLFDLAMKGFTLE